MIASVDRMMTERRGFPQFKAFDTFLVDLYRNRKPGRRSRTFTRNSSNGSRRTIRASSSRPSSDGDGPISHQQILRDLLEAVLV